MWIKELKNYEIEVKKDGETIYKGNSDDAPEEIKKMETEEVKFGKKQIDIIVK